MILDSILLSLLDKLALLYNFFALASFRESDAVLTFISPLDSSRLDLSSTRTRSTLAFVLGRSPFPAPLSLHPSDQHGQLPVSVFTRPSRSP